MWEVDFEMLKRSCYTLHSNFIVLRYTTATPLPLSLVRGTLWTANPAGVSSLSTWLARLLSLIHVSLIPPSSPSWSSQIYQQLCQQSRTSVSLILRWLIHTWWSLTHSKVSVSLQQNVHQCCLHVISTWYHKVCSLLISNYQALLLNALLHAFWWDVSQYLCCTGGNSDQVSLKLGTNRSNYIALFSSCL